MSRFTLTAHVLGDERTISALDDGTGVVLTGDFGSRRAGSMHEAERLAREYIGRHLVEAAGGKKPWGLVVSVSGFSALYGTPNPAAGVALGGGAPADPNSAPMRIYRRWRPGDSPMSALENAVQIIKAVVGETGRARAA